MTVIENSISRFMQLGKQCELIFVDGGSTDDGPKLLQQAGFHVLQHSCGHRGQQLNLGAQKARGERLLFLHIDTSLPKNFIAILEQARLPNGWGYFAVKLSGASKLLRMVEWSMNTRTRLTGMITGDHTLVICRDVFEQQQGFPDLPIMEDIAISRRLLQGKGQPERLPANIVTSSRKWEQEGIVLTIGRMWIMRLCYFFGVPPQRIYSWYYRNH